MDIDNQQYLSYLRSALHHLYELDELRRNPLATLLGVAERVDAASGLQKILLDSIDSMQPESSEPPQSNQWTIYEVLFFRYVRGYSREAVADQLGISDRQLSREQRTALETLALHVWKTYHLESQQQIGTTQASEWVESLPPETSSAWKPILLSVLELLTPLMEEQEVRVQISEDEPLPDLLVSQMMLRHSLLNILGMLIPLSSPHPLLISPSVSGQSLILTIQVPQIFTDAISVSPAIEVARQLVERAGGNLIVDTVDETARVTFSMPALQQIPVLVIDDNPDTLLLFQRYVQGTRYSLVGVQQPGEGIRLIEKIKPRIVVMDVMMPELDGWDLLARLRQNRQPSQLQQSPCAIIICSILPQESLARNLGADGFLQKPVLPQDFLRALDWQIDHISQE